MSRKNIGRRFALYCRIAHEMPDGSAMEIQKKQLEQYAAENELEVTVIIEEYGNGLTLNRSGIQRITRMAKEKEIDGVLVTKLDKLCRSSYDSYCYLQFLNQNHVRCLCTQNPNDVIKKQTEWTEALIRYAEKENQNG